MLYTTEAINLKTSRFGEADKIVVLFTKAKGKVSAIAKSALKPGSKFGGRLEAFAYNEVLLAEGKNLDIISQIETKETFYFLNQDESSLNAGLYMIKILYSFLEPKIKNEPLFELLKESLYMLKNGESPENTMRIFDIRLADIEGFLPLYNFSKNMQLLISNIKKGNVSLPISSSQRSEIDSVLAPSLCEHVGKDIRSWKNL